MYFISWRCAFLNWSIFWNQVSHKHRWYKLRILHSFTLPSLKKSEPNLKVQDCRNIFIFEATSTLNTSKSETDKIKHQVPTGYFNISSDFYLLIDRQSGQQALSIPAPTSFSSSSMLFLILSYSSSIAWLPRIWDRILRALWVCPFWMSQRGLSGRNRNPRNCITAGTADRPSMYLEICKKIDKYLLFAYKNTLYFYVTMIQLQLLKLYLQMKSPTPRVLSHCKLRGQESHSAGILENMTLSFISRKSQGHVDCSATTDYSATGLEDTKLD